MALAIQKVWRKPSQLGLELELALLVQEHRVDLISVNRQQLQPHREPRRMKRLHRDMGLAHGNACARGTTSAARDAAAKAAVEAAQEAEAAVWLENKRAEEASEG